MVIWYTYENKLKVAVGQEQCTEQRSPLHPAQEGVTDPQWQGEGAVGEFTVQVNYYTTRRKRT